MTWRWPWRKVIPATNGEAAAAAKAGAMERLVEQHQRWPEVWAARDGLARMAEQAMRGHR